MEVMIAHVRDEVVPPSRLQADLPADLEQVILRCLAKKPENRFQDVGSLEQALSDCGTADRWTQADAERWWHENNQPAEQQASMAATA
jgi:serine/threonine-protein kinase